MNAPLAIAGALFGLPNTLAGVAFALLGALAGARLRLARGVLETLDHPLVARGAAIALGHVILYGRDAAPGRRLANGHSFDEHERQHVIQSMALGPLYLPAHLAFGVVAWLVDGRWHGPANRLERGPLATPPRPWA